MGFLLSVAGLSEVGSLYSAIAPASERPASEQYESARFDISAYSQPAASLLDALGVVDRKPAQVQGTEPVGRRAAVGMESESFVLRFAGLVTNGVVIDEVEAAVFVLAAPHEHDRGLRGVGIECIC